MIEFECRRVKWTEYNTDTEVGCNPRRRDLRFGIKSIRVGREFGTQTRRAGPGNAAPLFSGVGVLRNHRCRGGGFLAFRRFEAEGGREFLFLKERPSSSL